MKEKDIYFISAAALSNFLNSVLLNAGVRSDVADYVTCGLIQTSLRGVDSHGVRLFPHYLEALQGGRINPNPHYRFQQTSASTALLDADHTFGHAAGMEAAKKAVTLAEEAGSGQIAVYNSTHFGAAAYYALEIAKHDMIGMSFTNTDALIRSYAGRRAFLGNNPVCFAAPCAHEEPFCLDMATSILTFNKIKQLASEGKAAPAGVAADGQGRESTDPNKIAMLLPVGGYKGYGLSLAVEILCSLLTGAPYGVHIPKMFEAPLNQKRFLGHFITATRIDCFQDKNVFKQRLAQLIAELRSEPAEEKNVPVQVAGDPEKRLAEERKNAGIPVHSELYQEFVKIGRQFKVALNV